MKFFKFGSLRARIVMLSLGIIFALGTCGAVLVHQLALASKESVEHNFDAFAHAFQAAIAAQFYERYGDVQAFALNPILHSNDRKAVESLLNSYAAGYGIYDLIMVVDAKGRLVGVNTKSPTGQDLDVSGLYKDNYSDAPWFKEVMAGRFSEDKEKGFQGTYVEDVGADQYTSAVYGEQRLGNSFSAAINNSQGETIGVVTNRAASRWFENAFHDTYTGMLEGGIKDASIQLLNKAGVIFAEYEPSAHGGKLDYFHDWKILGKENLLQKKHPIAVELAAGKEGVRDFYDDRMKVQKIAGYTPVNEEKFLPSLGWGGHCRRA